MFKTLGLYIAAPAVLLGMLALSQASSTSRGVEPKNLKGEVKAVTGAAPRTKTELTAAGIACIGAAVNTREAALGSGIAAYTVAVQAAYSARAVALQAAYSSTDTTQIRTSVKAAWTAFGASSKAAGRTWKAAQKAAWTQFATTAKACKATGIPTDTANSTSETKGE